MRSLSLVMLWVAAFSLTLGACDKKKDEAEPAAAKTQPAKVQAPSKPPMVNKDIQPWNEARCKKVLAEMRAEVDGYRGCEKDADCRAAPLGCPFGCPAVLNQKAPLAELKQKLAPYHKNCPCREPCEPGKRVFLCRDGRCDLKIEAIESK